MIDEKKLIEDMLNNDGIDFRMDFNTDTEDSVLESLREFADKFRQGMIELVKKQQKVGEWILVSERLPETDKNRKYLVCGEKGGIYIAEFVCNTVHGKPLETSWWTAHGRYCPNPIAWMPLPEAYKE